MALFTCPERVVRDGVLIAFKGEKMSEAEAKRRGVYQLAQAPDQAPAQVAEAAKTTEAPALDVESKTVAELKAMLDEAGVDYKAKATKAELIDLAKGL